jgi:hypothetical protein
MRWIIVVTVTLLVLALAAWRVWFSEAEADREQWLDRTSEVDAAEALPGDGPDVSIPALRARLDDTLKPYRFSRGDEAVLQELAEGAVRAFTTGDLDSVEAYLGRMDLPLGMSADSEGMAASVGLLRNAQMRAGETAALLLYAGGSETGQSVSPPSPGTQSFAASNFIEPRAPHDVVDPRVQRADVIKLRIPTRILALNIAEGELQHAWASFDLTFARGNPPDASLPARGWVLTRVAVSEVPAGFAATAPPF